MIFKSKLLLISAIKKKKKSKLKYFHNLCFQVIFCNFFLDTMTIVIPTIKVIVRIST